MKPELCEQCGVNPRPKGCKKCSACTTANRVASSRHFSKIATAKRSAKRAEKNKDVVCACGCGVHITPPAKYTPACRIKVNEELRVLNLERAKERRAGKIEAKKPDVAVVAKIASAKDEQTAIDLAIHAAYLKRSGMDTVNKCRSLSPAEIAALVAQGKVTPIHLIPHKDLPGNDPWSGYAGRGICA